MTGATRRRWVLGGIALAAAVAGGVLWRLNAPIVVAAPPPAVAPDLASSLPPLPPSTVIAPIVYDLAPQVAYLDSIVPRTFGAMDKRIRANDRTEIAFAIQRSPFQVRVDDGELVLDAVIEYEGRAWYKAPLVPAVSAGCGGGGGPRPRLRVRIRSVPAIDSAWRLRTRTRVERAVPYSDDRRDQCKVTFLKVDVTERVIDAATAQVDRQLARLDRRIARFDVRGRMERVWQIMSRPIKLTDSIFLAIQPRAAALEGITGQGDTLIATVRLEARPEIVTGARPPAELVTSPLPFLSMRHDTATGFTALVKAAFDYATATRLMRRGLAGRTITAAGRRVTIEDVELTGIGGGRVALGVTFSGAVRGRMYLTGTPRVDSLARRIAVPDLDFDVGSADLLVAGLDWVKGGAIRDYLRERAVIPDSAALAAVQRLAERGMNRRLTEGVHLVARLERTRAIAAQASTQELVVEAAADGELGLEIDRVVGRRRPRGR